MKKFLMYALLGLAALSTTGCGYEKINPGYAGVLVNLHGSEKGVDEGKVLPPGRYYPTWNEDIYTFPLFSQTYVWTQGTADETSPADESIDFQDKDGLALNADLGVTYTIDKSLLPVLFQTYRRGVDEITDLVLRNKVRDALVKRSSKMGVEQIYGAGKTELIEFVEASVRDEVKSVGIKVERVYWIGGIRLPKNIQQALNDKLQANQKAQQRENEVAQAKAEADKEIERARGDAESLNLRAEAEANSIKIRADALRSNPEVVELIKAEAQREAVAKWNGTLPTQMIPGSAVPFINIGK